MGAFAEEYEIIRLDAYEEGDSKRYKDVVNKFADALEEYCLKNGTSPEDSVETVVTIPEYREPVLKAIRDRSKR